MQKLPRGVYILSILLFVAGGGLLLAALALPILGANIIGDSTVPWYVYVLYALYFLAIGWGLWGGRRWAYIATLLMCVVLAFYQFQVAIVLQRNSLFQFLILAAIFVYLIQPQVRASFLRRDPSEAV
jgi:uncharacterized membrane protein (DUF2068 family)